MTCAAKPHDCFHQPHSYFHESPIIWVAVAAISTVECWDSSLISLSMASSSSALRHVPIDDLRRLLSCKLCGQWLRNAHSIKECLHTFCYLCLRKHFRYDEIDEVDYNARHAVDAAPMDLRAPPTIEQHTPQPRQDKGTATSGTSLKSAKYDWNTHTYTRTHTHYTLHTPHTHTGTAFKSLIRFCNNNTY